VKIASLIEKGENILLHTAVGFYSLVLRQGRNSNLYLSQYFFLNIQNAFPRNIIK
jgi:hypothetical protein